MESTGVYWRPVFAVLETSFEVLLVNARHVKSVPGRKTDVRDCEWLAQLLECGLLSGSFVPPKPIRDLRDLTRYRKALIRDRGHHVNRVAKTLELANIKLGCVVTDIMGKSGRAILDALIAGVADVDSLADLAQGSVRKKRGALREAVEGRMTPHYAFLLRQQLSVIDELERHISQLDARIEDCIRPFDRAYEILKTAPGVAERAAQVIIAEIGIDMGQFPTPERLASWARVCPGTRESAGKRLASGTGKGNPWLRATLQEVAWAAARTRRSYYHALYYRLKARLGAQKAIVAVQHAVLVAIWHMLKNTVPHQDLGSDYFDRRNADRIRSHHVRRLQSLGYTVTVERAA
jgi:transposase